jgi:ferric-dicitrate binding protein FerR (iron transport regulator)
MDYRLIATYLADKCTAEERQTVEEWRTGSPENEALFQHWQSEWAVTSPADQNRVLGSEMVQPKRSLTKERMRSILISWLRQLAAIAVSGIILGAAIYLYQAYFYFPNLVWVEKNTSTAQKIRLQLSDDTVIWLNRNSKLQYPQAFGRTQREVYLEGEAYFEVAEDARKPFFIHNGSSLVRVLGTSFNLRGYADEKRVEVVVVTGKVLFTASPRSKNQIILKEGQKVMLDKRARQLTKSVNADSNFLAWKTGVLTFRNAALKDILPVLEQHYQVSMSTKNRKLLKCRFTGQFENVQLKDILKVFAERLNVRYRRKGTVYVLSSRGC